MIDEKVTKYMTFRLVEQKPKTGRWFIENRHSGSVIGEIKWYGPWRQYCFFPEPYTVFNNSCLSEIVNFIQELGKS